MVLLVYIPPCAKETVQTPVPMQIVQNESGLSARPIGAAYSLSRV